MKKKNREKERIIGTILFVLYVAFIIYFLIFSDWYGRGGEMSGYHYNLVPFKEIRRFWDYREEVGIWTMIMNLFGNVLVFVPFGFFLPMASRYRNFLSTVFWSFALSLGVEIFQLFSRLGSFDIDDIILNTLGGILGHILYAIYVAIRNTHDRNHKKKRRKRKKR